MLGILKLILSLEVHVISLGDAQNANCIKAAMQTVSNYSKLCSPSNCFLPLYHFEFLDVQITR